MQAFSIIAPTAAYLLVMPSGRPSKKERTRFGERVLEARLSLGLSQAQVAEQLGITQSSYADWERYSVALRPEQMVLLSEVLHVSVEDLLGIEKKRARGSGPVGKMRQIFEAATALPRHQQQHILSVVEAFVRQHANGTTRTD